MIFYAKARNSLELERSILERLPISLSQTLDAAKRYPIEGKSNIYQITISVEQIEK